MFHNLGSEINMFRFPAYRGTRRLRRQTRAQKQWENESGGQWDAGWKILGKDVIPPFFLPKWPHLLDLTLFPSYQNSQVENQFIFFLSSTQVLWNEIEVKIQGWLISIDFLMLMKRWTLLGVSKSMLKPKVPATTKVVKSKTKKKSNAYSLVWPYVH